MPDYDELVAELMIHCAEVLDARTIGEYRDAMQALCQCQDLSVHQAILVVCAFQAGLTIGNLMGSEITVSMN